MSDPIKREFNVSAVIRETHDTIWVTSPDSEIVWTIPRNRHLSQYHPKNAESRQEGFDALLDVLEQIACNGEGEPTE